MMLKRLILMLAMACPLVLVSCGELDGTTGSYRVEFDAAQDAAPETVLNARQVVQQMQTAIDGAFDRQIAYERQDPMAWGVCDDIYGAVQKRFGITGTVEIYIVWVPLFGTEEIEEVIKVYKL